MAARAHELSSHFPAPSASPSTGCVHLPLIAQPGALTITRAQALSVLSAQFLGILPHNSPTSDLDKGDCNIAVFSELIRSRSSEQVAKLQCYLQYFVSHMHRWPGHHSAGLPASYLQPICYRRCSVKQAPTSPGAAPKRLPAFQEENAVLAGVGDIKDSKAEVADVAFLESGM